MYCQYSFVPGFGLTRPLPEVSMRYSTSAPDSAITRPLSSSTGDLPSGCTFFSSGGAKGTGDMRWYLTISYGTPSSSSSHRMRCERELFRWWTLIVMMPSPAVGTWDQVNPNPARGLTQFSPVVDRAGLCRRCPPHRPERRTVWDLDFTGHFKTKASVDGQVRVLAGFQIAGNPRRIGDRKLMAHDQAAEALALFAGIGADGLEIPVRRPGVDLFHTVHRGHHVEHVRTEDAEQFGCIQDVVLQMHMPAVRRAPKRDRLVAVCRETGAVGQTELEQQLEHARQSRRAARLVGQQVRGQRIVGEGTGQCRSKCRRVAPDGLSNSAHRLRPPRHTVGVFSWRRRRLTVMTSLLQVIVRAAVRPSGGAALDKHIRHIADVARGLDVAGHDEDRLRQRAAVSFGSEDDLRVAEFGMDLAETDKRPVAIRRRRHHYAMKQDRVPRRAVDQTGVVDQRPKQHAAKVPGEGAFLGLLVDLDVGLRHRTQLRHGEMCRMHYGTAEREPVGSPGGCRAETRGKGEHVSHARSDSNG